MSIAAYHHKLLSLRQQATIQNSWLAERLQTILPALMSRENIDMWLVVAREYNEDPVLMTLLPQPAMSARRRTILVFARRNDGSLAMMSVSRYGYTGFYEGVWEPEKEDQYTCLERIIRQFNPQSIGINIGPEFSFGDGLSHSEYERLMQILAPWSDRIQSAEKLCIAWLEQRSPSEINAYPGIVALGHALIAEAFSSRVIHPGITTTEDVVWWLRETMSKLGLRPWFQPTIEIQAPGQSYDASEQRTLILHGDLLHCDVGFHYLGLATDQQQHAYVLHPHETDAPSGLKAALADANHLQDIHLNAMSIGKTGNQILKEALQIARSEGLNPQIYSHALGYHGHAAGPTIGLWDNQEGVVGRGDYPLYDNTCYSIELNIRRPIPEWSEQVVRIALEEDAILTNGQMRWLNGRQTQLHLIRG